MAQLLMLDDAIEQFLTVGASFRGYSEGTVSIYRRDLGRFRRFVLGQGISHPGDVTTTVLTQFLYGLNGGGKGLGPGSIQRTAAAIRALYSFLSDTGAVKQNPAASLKLPRSPRPTEPRVLTTEEASRLVDACQTPEEHAMIDLLLHTGIRRAELTTIRLGDFDMGAKTLVVHGKGNKDRTISLHPRALAAINEQLMHRDGPPCDRLFLSKYGGPMGMGRVRKIVARVARRAGLEGVHPHTLRHTCATLLCQSGADLRSVQEIMGHASIAITERYLHTSLGAMQRAVEKLSI